MTCTTAPPFRLLSGAEILSELGISRREHDRWRAQGFTPTLLRCLKGRFE